MAFGRDIIRMAERATVATANAMRSHTLKVIKYLPAGTVPSTASARREMGAERGWNLSA